MAASGGRGGRKFAFENPDAPDADYRTTNRKYTYGDDIRQRFAGYQKDTETVLDFAEARMYQNLHGRFTAIDPLLAPGLSANPQSFNRYAYVLNNPLIYTDPTGLQVGNKLEPCENGASCNGTYNPETNNVTFDNSTIAEVIVNWVDTAIIEPLQSFYQPGLDQITETAQFGGTLDQTPKVLGNKGFTQRQFFNTSNEYIGQKGQLLQDTLSIIDITGQASLASTSFRWQNGQASNFEMGTVAFGAIIAPLTFGSGEGKRTLFSAGEQVPNAGGVIRSFVTETDQIFFRVSSPTQNSFGGFLTSVRPRSSAFAREALALPPTSSASLIQEVLVPAGTRLQRSRALPAFGRRGGAEQFELIDRIPTANFGGRNFFQ